MVEFVDFLVMEDGTTLLEYLNLDKAFLRPDSRGVGSYQGDAIRNIHGTRTIQHMSLLCPIFLEYV